MTSSTLMCLVHFTSIYLFSSGEFVQDANRVYTYELPQLTRDILERIKAATGQPINTSQFFPILAASSKDYEIVEHHPYTKTARYLKTSKNNKFDKGRYLISKGDKHSVSEGDDFFKAGEQKHQFVKHQYDDHSGKKHKYNEEQFYKKNHHKSGGGKKGTKSKKGRKHGKFHLEKGFRDIYHKDEEKKADFFWNNEHEEGKWIKYGFKNRKSKKGHEKGGEGKKEKTKIEESSYKKEDKYKKCKTR